jgi:hypothetical protein
MKCMNINNGIMKMHRRKNKIQLVKLMKGKTNRNKRSIMVET